MLRTADVRRSLVQIFLTGGTGFIGHALVRAMRGRGWAVRVLVRDPQAAPARALAAQGCTLVRGDVTRSDGLESAMDGSDVVLHNAGIYEFGATAKQRRRMHQVNVHGTDHVLGAALAAGIARTVYVSTVWGLGASGYPPEPAWPKDESQRHERAYLTAYERTKAEAHQLALAWRVKGLPLLIAMPNAVVGANDHALFGYLLRLYLLGAMPPAAWGADTVISMVQLDALAQGLCVMAEQARIGEDYLLCGEPISIRALFAHWARYKGGMNPRVWLPRWLMRWLMAPLEPLQRALGLPAFLSRDAVDASRGHLNYSAAKARHDFGWKHPGIEEMWELIVREERELMAQRRGFLNRLRHQQLLATQTPGAPPSSAQAG
jgi:nucleoside-diphosphate-sugar epimerase